MRERIRVVGMGDWFDQNILKACMKFSKIKNDKKFILDLGDIPLTEYLSSIHEDIATISNTL